MRADDKPREECAVFGVSAVEGNAAGLAYNGLISLQHRGQDGAGIAAVYDGGIVCHKDVGLVAEVFGHGEINSFPSANVAVGHTRYGTTGKDTEKNVGPFVVEYLTGRIVVAHNGNITNAPQLRRELKTHGINFDATSDSEVISALIAYCITIAGDALQGIIHAAGRLRGAFSLIIATGDGRLVALRDANGFRPLCIGQSKNGIAVASESCALETCGFDFVRDVRPGEVVAVDGGSIVHKGIELNASEADRGLCIFEYVYFSRPDSVIDGLSVNEARHNMGLMLAKEHPADADCVCGVPDSGLEAAAGYAAASGLPLVVGFVKNRYIGRSFIYPTQSVRDDAVRLKLNPLATNVRGKRIVLVDDSIVRGTTCEKIVRSLKAAGAKEVHMRISSPPFRFTCHYGTDIDEEENLIANKMDIAQIADKLGVDSLGYISIEGLKAACAKCRLGFCTACFTGTGDTSRAKKDIFETN